MQECANCDQFFDKCEKAANDLKAAGATVTEYEKIKYMIRALPAEYSYIGDLIDLVPENQRTVDYLKDKIRTKSMEQQLSFQEVKLQSNTFAATRNFRGQRGHFARGQRGFSGNRGTFQQSNHNQNQNHNHNPNNNNNHNHRGGFRGNNHRSRSRGHRGNYRGQQHPANIGSTFVLSTQNVNVENHSKIFISFIYLKNFSLKRESKCFNFNYLFCSKRLTFIKRTISYNNLVY